ncbi:transposase (23) [Bacillus methanolicus PB1]|uniref:Transposase (23) n=1 Tax=Bacillus methanolicus PB1 TaxID=997296 RepID=I3E1K7_BACMT|nr:hypothetical protein [Bacillus methanolicus]EIJ80378.1 transposase (23) [Bacillus methanolicus PB1]
MTKTVQILQEYFRHLRMSETANELPPLLRNAEKMSWTYQEFLQKLEKNLAKRWIFKLQNTRL